MPQDQGQLPDNNRLALRQVVRACRKAALATLMAEPGQPPYASLVTIAFDHDLAPILLLSGLSDHSRNLAADARVSLLLDGTEGHANPQTGPRVTLMGRAERSDDPRLAARFLARHPAAALYSGFGDFGFWRVVPQRAHFVGGFGRAVWFDYPFGLAPSILAEAEPTLLEQVNASHSALFARLGQNGAGWRAAALDADGLDLSDGENVLRVAFPQPVEDGAGLARQLELLNGKTVPWSKGLDIPH